MTSVKTDMSKIGHPVLQYDTSLHLITSLPVQNGTWAITMTSSTTSLTIIKYISRPKSTAVKDIDIADILGQKYRYRPW